MTTTWQAGCRWRLNFGGGIDLDRVAPDHPRELLDATWWLTVPAKVRELRERKTR
ncbi:hypothetical protein [Nocardia sp. NPDC057455]|uniref:hypothetical protein n=1 Tax=Nocardia sp. NPDC057455 TaxID=3346138 RepID=UPI00366E7BFE